MTMRMSPQGVMASWSIGCPSTKKEEVDQPLLKGSTEVAPTAVTPGTDAMASRGAIEERDPAPCRWDSGTTASRC